MYYNARYYDPALGRFITADSVIPGADNTQAYNRYMYVAGNPMKYKDPGGHKWGSGSWKKIAGAVIGGALGGVTGAAVGYAAVKYRNNIKNFISDHGKQILTTAAGYLIGGPIGAIYGYAAGSDGGIKEFWNDHKWFRIMTYVLVTAAVVAACVVFGPIVMGSAAFLSSWALYGACIGAAIGAAYGGTNGFHGGWNWEGAAKGMMFGAIAGALVGETANDYYTFCTNPSTSGIIGGTETGKIAGGGIPGYFFNSIGNPLVIQYGAGICWFWLNYQVISLTYNTGKYFHDGEFTYVPGCSYDIY